MKIVYDPNSLCHYGVLGMKWGRRKSKAKSSGKKASKKTKKDKSSNREKILTDVRKQKIKAVAKTTAKVAGKVAVGSILGYVGVMAFDEAFRSMRKEIYSIEDKLNAQNTNIEGFEKINTERYGRGNTGESHAIDTYRDRNTGKTYDIIKDKVRLK